VVEKAGKETTSAKISAILNDTAAFRLASQSKGEELADKAVIPTLTLASIGYGTVGFQGATAIINSDFGTGIRMAAPLALLSSLSTCAKRGILVKDGKALEQMSSIDTVLFDKTGTLTSERPTVSRIPSVRQARGKAHSFFRGGRRTAPGPSDCRRYCRRISQTRKTLSRYRLVLLQDRVWH
jgi:P-type E1-E2 ATPase